MKNIERLKMVFNRIFKTTFKVTDIEVLENQLSGMKKELCKANDLRNDTRAQMKQKQEKKIKLKETLKRLEEINKENYSKGKEEEVKQGYQLKLRTEREIKTLEQSITGLEKLVNSLDNQIKVYEGQVGSIADNIDVLRAKDEFTTNANNFKKTMKKLNVNDVGDVCDNIDKNFFKAEFDLEDISKKSVKIDDLINDSDKEYEKYLNTLGKKETNSKRGRKPKQKEN